jgi:hypothetical protein
MTELVCRGLLARRCEGPVTVVEVDTGGHESSADWTRMALCGACLEVAHRLYAVRSVPAWLVRGSAKDLSGAAMGRSA